MTKLPEKSPETAEEVWHALLPVLDALLHRVAKLEAQAAMLTPKAGPLPTPSTLTPDRLYEMWQRGHSSPDPHEQVMAYAERRWRHAQFIPDYDSEGAY